MPLTLARHYAVDEPKTSCIEIGLLNNLSDAGLARGDRQIFELLAVAVGDAVVRLSFFSLPSITRGAEARAWIEAHYRPFAELKRSGLRGLIVTSCEPQADVLSDEPFWSELRDIIDWAEHNTQSTIWSCMAAHAAVLHLDGVERRRLPIKRSGVFQVDVAEPHPLLLAMPQDTWVPHSRWNDLDRSDLRTAGYQVLTCSEIAGVDTFVKQWRSFFVYLQGHPEYDSGALGREYRRDVSRYLQGVSRDYPPLPEAYFDASDAAALTDFARLGRRRQNPDLVQALPNCLSGGRVARFGLGPTLFRNWLHYLGDPNGARLASEGSEMFGIAV